ncbi:MAG: hypothetical protein KGL39_36640 [Patescibacteria group bacterium]|nr:hypothetical protein [Patescibacteria group bacterium]
MADNTVLNTGTGGDTIATDDLATINGGAVSGVKVQRVKPGYGLDSDFTDVSLTNPLPIQPAGTAFIFSASGANSTTTQLAGGAVFTGTVESVLNQQCISIDLACDQPGTLTVAQYIDAGGTQSVGSWTFSIAGGAGFNRNFTANGNYHRLTFQNLGTVATTTLNISTAYGTLPAVTNLGNNPSAINEIGGVAVSGSIPTTVSGTVQVTGAELRDQYNPDAPSPVFMRGDPNGDFAGTNPLETWLSGNGEIVAPVRVVQPLGAVDKFGAGIISDCPDGIGGMVLDFRTVGQVIDVDCSGYQTLHLLIKNGGTITASQYNDPSSATNIVGIMAAAVSGGSAVWVASSLPTNNNYVIPVYTRFIRFTSTVANTQIILHKRSGVTPLVYNQPVAANCTLTQFTPNSSGMPIGAIATTDTCTFGTQVTATTPAALNVKASAGRIFLLNVGNPNTSAVYLKLFNTTSVTLGTTSASQSFMIPASSTITIQTGDKGLYYSTGIQMAVTGGQSLTDNTAITTGCSLNYSFV